VERDDQLEVHPEDSAAGAPIVDDSAPRRRRRLLIIAAGTLAGLVIGGLVVVFVDSPRATGNSDNPHVWLFGLPLLLAIAGTVVGWVTAGAFSAGVVDAPVRQRRFMRSRRAATSTQGQLPGSPVPPHYETPRSGRHGDQHQPH
jgi:hypothetical protein